MKTITSLLITTLLTIASAVAQDDKPVGLILNESGAFQGYNLFSPLDAGNTYLMDNEGRLLHSWESEYRPANQPYLLENGNLLRAAGYGRGGNGTFHGGGAGYRVEEFSWEGEKLWEFVYANDMHLMHHDIAPMPNGNVLILAWEMKTGDEAIAAGRDPKLVKEELWPEHILEVKPIRPEGAEIVWEWHLWDHLVQDYDDTKDNFGDVAAHPQLVEINPTGHWMDRISDEEKEQLEALGYLGGDEESEPKKRRGGTGADWHHSNAINYNAKLDQIAFSLLGNNELWIIDHSTTTEEAKGHTGGRSGKGGDLLYRWGNPIAYRAGLEQDQQLFAQHDVHWIPDDRPGGGNILVFNNGRGRADGNYSSIVEIATPLTSQGTYRIEAGQPFGPAAPTWEYTAPEKKDFYSNFISGAQRLPNGNTLICEGASGTFFEVTPDKEIVWRYVNPAVPPQPERASKDDDRESRRQRRKFTNIVYRIYRYANDYPAFQGKNLRPGPLLTEHLETNPAITPKELPKAD